MEQVEEEEDVHARSLQVCFQSAEVECRSLVDVDVLKSWALSFVGSFGEVF